MSILSLLEKHKGRDLTRSTERIKPRYWCVVCNRPRSTRYHSRHPAGEPPPPAGICRRCIHKEDLPPLAIKIYEVYHYHHACECLQAQSRASAAVELPLCPAYPECAELSGEEKKCRLLSPNQLERAPPAKLGMKPRYRSE
jgi:hypothetical protein